MWFKNVFILPILSIHVPFQILNVASIPRKGRLDITES